MNWIEALKKWNTGKGKWCIPRKGTPEYDEVKALMTPKAAKPTAAAKPKAEPKRIQRMRAKIEKLQKESDNIAALEYELEGKLPQKYVDRDSDITDQIFNLERDIQYWEVTGEMP